MLVYVITCSVMLRNHLFVADELYFIMIDEQSVRYTEIFAYSNDTCLVNYHSYGQSVT